MTTTALAADEPGRPTLPCGAQYPRSEGARIVECQLDRGHAGPHVEFWDATHVGRSEWPQDAPKPRNLGPSYLEIQFASHVTRTLTVAEYLNVDLDAEGRVIGVENLEGDSVQLAELLTVLREIRVAQPAQTGEAS